MSPRFVLHQTVNEGPKKSTAIGGLNLKNDDLIVDVGGNIGAVTHILYEAFQNLRYVVQDLEKPLVFAKRVGYSVTFLTGIPKRYL